ncbi:anti-sigma regulatory factor [Kurthia sibirica]|uniref:ATP-binding protein n=1 Tax=Kurthia sibirica TaxID=202750 RepID=A0A2U3AK16_9BACL|nr:anti-sigma regulatory factor [Kurthia sibirica]PWI24888.1 ATP-binding protein [Kurthia sibirica]GEK33207.1 serine/threonine-protein kinase RsbT [Kurthia sibirica]
MVDSSVNILTEWDIVEARQLGRNKAKDIGFGAVDQARITTAISELARNIYLYADGGTIVIEELKLNDLVGIKITAEDKGPGIQDIRLVMQDGYSTSQGLGAGLPGVRRLMDEFDINTIVNEGTVVSIIKWLRLGSD